MSADSSFDLIFSFVRFVMNAFGIAKNIFWNGTCAVMAVLLFAASCDASVSRDKNAFQNMDSGSATEGSAARPTAQDHQGGSAEVALISDQTAEIELTDESYEAELRARAPKGISHSFYSCIAKAGVSKLDVAACISREKDVQDSRLNTVYKKLMSELDEESKPLLLEAQRAWLRSNQNESLLEDRLFGGGMMGNLTVAEGELFKLCIRANLLESYLDDVPQKADGAEVK